MAERAKATGKSQKRGRGKQNGRGHNSGEVATAFPSDIPDEVRKRHLDAIAKAELAVEKARKPLKAAQARLRAAKKTAEDDGCNVPALYDARRLSSRDRLDVVHRYKETGHFLRLMESPLATQLELFRSPDWPEPVSINLQGYRDGKAGVAFDSPFKVGTDEFISYKAGYDTAQQELQDALRRENAN